MSTDQPSELVLTFPALELFTLALNPPTPRLGLLPPVAIDASNKLTLVPLPSLVPLPYEIPPLNPASPDEFIWRPILACAVIPSTVFPTPNPAPVLPYISPYGEIPTVWLTDTLPTPTP